MPKRLKISMRGRAKTGAADDSIMAQLSHSPEKDVLLRKWIYVD